MLRTAVFLGVCCIASDCQRQVQRHPRQRHPSANRLNIWACAPDILLLCKDVKPGDGRMEECLTSKHQYLNSMCAGRRTHPDNLPHTCKDDVAALCPKTDHESHHLMCLRKHRNKITQQCWDEISALGSDGWEMLPRRFKGLGVDTVCSSALISACGNIAPGFGDLLDCVDQKWNIIANDCGLRERDIPERVPPACHSDSLLLCKHTTPGNNRIHDCLWKFDWGERDEGGHTLSKDCLSSLILESHGMDIECAKDVTERCGHNHRDQRRLVHCLHGHQEKLAHGCTTRKYRHLLDESDAPAPTHHNLHSGTHANDCAGDIRKYCAGIRAGHGLVHQCLVDNRHRLSPECRVPRGQVVKRGSGAEEERAIAAAAARRRLQHSEADESVDDAGEAESWDDVSHLVFEKNDRDHDGSLSAAEVSAALLSRYTRDLEGELARDTKALLMVKRYDADNSSGIDEEEFKLMTRSVLGVGSEPAIGDGADTREGNAAGEGSEKDLGRGFQRKQQSAILGLLTSYWVLVPLAMGAVIGVVAYRSIVRHTKGPSRVFRAGYVIKKPKQR